MSAFESLLSTVKTMIVLESKLNDLNKNLDLLTDGYRLLSERVSRLEGKFEAYENVASRRKPPKSLPGR